MLKKASACVRRTFTPEFKRDAVARVRRGKMLTEGAISLGIARSLLQYWRNQLEGELSEPFPGKGKARAEIDELCELKARLKDFTKERDILKEALGRSMTRCNTFSILVPGDDVDATDGTAGSFGLREGGSRPTAG